MHTTEITGTHGITRKTECTILTAETGDGTWYVVEGGTIVNFTYEELKDGVYIEGVTDVDCFTWGEPITTLDQLIEAIES